VKTEGDGQRRADDAAGSRGWLEQVPPWRVFPAMRPVEVAARQGAEEAWVDEVWRPFWASLDAPQRTAYLDHWQASDAWRDAIHHTFDPAPGFDAQADLMESNAHLEQRRLAQAAEKRERGGLGGLLGRLFGRR
jgi:hypothetical protein